MADQRITELVELPQGGVSFNDVLPIADVSASQTKKVQVKSLIQAGFNLADASTLDISKINQASVAKLGTASLGTNVVTYDKIQQVSSTDRLLGRSSGGAGNIEEIICTSFARSLLDDADAATVRSTLSLGVVATGNTINTSLIEDLAVTTGKINDSAVTTAKIADANVTNAKIASSAVDSAQLAASGVIAGKIAANAVTTVTIVDSGVTQAKLSANAVATINIASSGITQSKIAADAIATINIVDSGITQSKLAANAVNTVNFVDSGITQPKLASDAVATINIVNASVTLAKMASGSVDTGQLIASGVTQEKLAASSVATINIIDSGVTQSKLAANSIATINVIASGITQEKLAANAVATVNIVDSGITQGKLASGSVATVNLVDSGVTTNKLASGSVTISKLNISSGELSGAVITASSIPLGSHIAGSILTADLADNVVTFTKIQQVASGVLLGRASSGSGNVEAITLTAAGRALLDDIDASTQRATLGLGSLAIQNTVASGNYDAASIVSSDIRDGAIVTSKLVDSGVTTIKIADGSVTVDKLASNSVSTVKIIDSGVTTIKIADSGVTQSKLAANAVATVNLIDSGVTQQKVASGAIATINIVDAAVTIAKMASGSIGTAQLVASGVTQEKLAASSIATVNIIDSGVTQAKLAANAVATVNIADSGVTTAKLASGSITISKLGIGAGELSGTLITASSIPSGSYASGSILTASVADNAVTFAKMQQVASGVLLGRSSAGSGNVETIALTAAGRALLDDADASAQRTTLGLGSLAVQNTVASGNYDAASIVTADIANNAITTAKLADSGVTTAKLVDANVTEVKLASNSVSTGKIVDSGVTTAKIANNAVTYAKIQATSTSDVLLGRSSASGGTVEEITCTSAARSILDDATVADIRTTLGLGTLAVQNGSFSGTSTGTNTGDQTITLSGDVIGTGTGGFSTTISNDAVTTAKIIDGAVSTAKIIDSGVTAVKLADNSAAIVAGSTPVGNGDFTGQQWLNTNTGVEYTWTGSAWLRQSGLSTTTISGDIVYSFTSSYPDAFSASIVPSLNTQVASRFFAGPASGSADTAPTFRAITADDLPKATTAALGVAQAGTGLVTVSGIFNHANTVASGTYYKVTVDAQGHISAGTASLVSDDIPSLPASKITTGTFGSGLIADDAILASKLANYSVSQFGEAPPVADFIGQFFFNPLEKDLYLWDGNVWNPVGISVGEIIFAGTYNASGNTIASTSSDGAAVGLSIGQPLPSPSATFNRYYVVVESGGTGVSPAPETILQPPDILLCNGSAWTEVDVSSTYIAQSAANVGFTPAASINSTNVQAALEEVSTECRNVNNVASGILVTGYGGTGFNSYTKGDILVASGATLLKQAVGTNGQMLTADSSRGTGVQWTTPTSGTVLSVSANAPLTVVSGTTNPVLSIPDATTSVRGSVILSDSTSTTSSTIAATATAVKSAFDLANAALPRTGGTITGEVVIGSAGTLLFEGATDNTFEIQLAAADATSDKVVTLPDTTGTIITTGDSGTVTNLMLAGSIADTKLSTISTAGKVSNSATTATSANTGSAIVARDSSGNFAAGTIDAIIDEGTF